MWGAFGFLDVPCNTCLPVRSAGASHPPRTITSCIAGVAACLAAFVHGGIHVVVDTALGPNAKSGNIRRPVAMTVPN